MDITATTAGSPASGTTNLVRDLGLSVLGCAVFGAAAAAGHGALPMLRGAWAAPALFVGGAALSAPPLYLFNALAGGRVSAADVVRATTRSLSGASIALLGLAAPAAFFSTTLGSAHAALLLTLAVIVVGGAAVFAVAGGAAASADGGGGRPALAATIWCLFALLLGARLIASLAGTVGLLGMGASS